MLEIERDLTTDLQKISILNSAISSLEMAQKQTEEALTAINKLPDTTKIYKPIGRMYARNESRRRFMMKGKEELKTDMTKNITGFQSDIAENKVKETRREC